jgi:hypothetical protein
MEYQYYQAMDVPELAIKGLRNETSVCVLSAYADCFVRVDLPQGQLVQGVESNSNVSSFYNDPK